MGNKIQNKAEITSESLIKLWWLLFCQGFGGWLCYNVSGPYLRERLES